MKRNDKECAIQAGDHIMQPPGVAHHILNAGEEDLLYYVIADNPPLDMYYYPDSDKWGIQSASGYFRFHETTTYWDGEDPADERNEASPDER